MTKEARLTLFNAIHASPGMAHINRTHSRSFSLNIFQENSRELIQAILHVRDSDHGLRLMAQDNKEAGTQAHREINRLVHNFVASAKSLVDHTRSFMKQNYAGTSLARKYQDRVDADLKVTGVVKFVHDTRNYMVHRGLPNSNMFVSYTRDPISGEATLTTGIKYKTRELLDWDGWTQVARSYIESAGAELDIHQFAEEYLARVSEFQKWLSHELDEYHAQDLAALLEMQRQHDQLGAQNETFQQSVDQIAEGAAFQFSEDMSVQIDNLSNQLLGNIREIQLPPQGTGEFSSQRPAVKVNLDKAHEPPIFWRQDQSGNDVLSFIYEGNKAFGLSEDAYEGVSLLTEAVFQARWATEYLSARFIQDEFIRWCRSSFNVAEKMPFSRVLERESQKKVAILEIWLPVSNLEVECGFTFGPVRIEPITAAMLDHLEAQGIEWSPNQHGDVLAMFRRLRAQVQGLAAIVVDVEAEPRRAEQKAFSIARDALDLLRFFAPAATNVHTLCPQALLGTEFIPRKHVLVLSQKSFTYKDAVIPDSICNWSISANGHDRLRRLGLERLEELVCSEELSPLQAGLRASLILYSAGTTSTEAHARVSSALEAIENMFLRHEIESPEINVQKRLVLLLAKDDLSRTALARNIREIYRLNRRLGYSASTENDHRTMREFVANAHRALRIVLGNSDRFETKGDFIDALEASE
jgi:hypothetical protein